MSTNNDINFKATRGEATTFEKLPIGAFYVMARYVQPGDSDFGESGLLQKCSDTEASNLHTRVYQVSMHNNSTMMDGAVYQVTLNCDVACLAGEDTSTNTSNNTMTEQDALWKGVLRALGIEKGYDLSVLDKFKEDK